MEEEEDLEAAEEVDLLEVDTPPLLFSSEAVFLTDNFYLTLVR